MPAAETEAESASLCPDKVARCRSRELLFTMDWGASPPMGANMSSRPEQGQITPAPWVKYPGEPAIRNRDLRERSSVYLV